MLMYGRYADVWERIVAKHNLQALSLDELVGGSWEFTDNSMGGWGVVQQNEAEDQQATTAAAAAAAAPSELKIGVLLSTIKLMQAGAWSVRGFRSSASPPPPHPPPHLNLSAAGRCRLS
jgi:hypothetical protein